MTEALTRPASADLAAHLLQAHAASDRWAAVVAAVPREQFIPDLVWAFDQSTGRSEPVDRRVDPDGWARAVYSDTALTIQFDGGDHHGTEPGTVPTSSASQPSVVTAMLEDARLKPGMRVLEAGTGTGWSAALTAHVTGPGTVTSIEFDPQVARVANRNLTAAGVRVRTEVGDAAEGFDADAPYDRVIATYGVRRIPPAWIAQTRPGGLVVAPWGTAYSHRDAVAVLTVNDDGSASGKFTRQVEFMKTRTDRQQPAGHDDYLDASPLTRMTDTALTYADIIGGPWDPAVFVTGLLVPGVTHVVDRRNPDRPVVWWYSLTDLSWAVATFRPDKTTIGSGGALDVWAEVEAAVSVWTEEGRPGVERFGLTVEPDGTHVVWLDDPERVVAIHHP